MRLYAEDAMETDEPWKLWEYSLCGGWEACIANPQWSEKKKYRRIDPYRELKEAHGATCLIGSAVALWVAPLGPAVTFLATTAPMAFSFVLAYEQWPT